MAKFSIGILFALVMAAAAHGQATIVIGQSPAARCYQNAIWGRSHSSALRPCDSALQVAQLTYRERQRTWVNRAVVNLHLGEPEAALHDLQQAVDLGFESAEIDMNRSAAYIRLARYQDAIDAATRAIDAGLRDVEKAYFNRAVAYERLGRIAEAYDDFSAAAAAAPHWQQPLRQLERFRVSNGT